MKFVLALCLLLLTAVSVSAFSGVEKLGPVVTRSTVNLPSINGPSLVKVPSWSGLPGTHCLFFADHVEGKRIRVACADDIEGPYTKFGQGVLRANWIPDMCDVASPDVHVDEVNQQFVMYFHGRTTASNCKKQFTRRATSPDGTVFAAEPGNLARAYLRVFKKGARYYGLTRRLYRLRTDGSEWVESHNVLPQGPNGERIRHVAVHVVDNNTLWVFFSRIGELQEHIRWGTIDMSVNWKSWTITEHAPLVIPTQSWEGASLPMVTSTSGPAHGPVNQLRDPFFYEEDGEMYIFYAFAGEEGIALGRLLQEQTQ